jgi:hypothetical protein
VTIDNISNVATRKTKTSRYSSVHIILITPQYMKPVVHPFEDLKNSTMHRLFSCPPSCIDGRTKDLGPSLGLSSHLNRSSIAPFVTVTVVIRYPPPILAYLLLLMTQQHYTNNGVSHTPRRPPRHTNPIGGYTTTLPLAMIGQDRISSLLLFLKTPVGAPRNYTEDRPPCRFNSSFLV